MKKIPLIVIFATLITCLYFTVQNRWKGDNWKTTINADGYGYYAYLPCIFIYHGLDYKRAWKEEQKITPGAIGFTMELPHNKVLDKWFPGVALLLVPFFLIAYLLSYLFGYSMGGYEFLFQASVSLGALFYLIAGLIFISKLLKKYNIPEFIIGFTLVLIVFGTNIFYYSTMEPSMSHVYSFGLTAIFLFYTKKSIDEFRLKNLLPMVISISILALIRPTNLLSLAFIPFLAGSSKNTVLFITSFFKSKKTLLLLFIAASILFIQFFLWYLQTGHFFIWSYSGEGFNFKTFHFFDILVSYRNGWYVYTPLMFIATLGGLITLYRRNIFLFFSALFFFLLVTYVLSSWWAWWYGGAFGLRAFIDFYSIFALLLSIFLSSLTSLWNKVTITFIACLCIGLNIFQTNQYINSILPPDGMTQKKYWKIFLKNDSFYKYLFDYPDTSDFIFLNSPIFKNDFEQNTWGNNQDITNRYAHSGTHSAFIDEQNQFSPALVLKASMIPQISPLSIYVKLWTYMPDFKNNATIIVSVKTEKGDSYFWKSSKLQSFVFDRNVWTQVYGLMNLPIFKNPSDKISVYIYNTKSGVYIDDVEVMFGRPK